MPTITFTATAPDGSVHTRTSGTMPYTHAAVVNDPADQSGWGVYSWHKSRAAAQKAVSSGYLPQRYPQRQVVEAVPTAINGRVERGQFADWPNAERIAELVEAKLAGNPARVPADARATGGNAVDSSRSPYDPVAQLGVLRLLEGRHGAGIGVIADANGVTLRPINMGDVHLDLGAAADLVRELAEHLHGKGCLVDPASR